MPHPIPHPGLPRDPHPDWIELIRTAFDGLGLPPVTLERWIDRMEGAK